MSLEKYLDALKKESTFSDIVYERSLTDKEKNKREEIAKAIERDNPTMDKSKKMAIATAQAKKVAESLEQIDEAGTAHPLPGHDYHKKTDAELHFIARDAKEAEDAMSGHNPKAANKYADQKNDAVTVLHFRKKGMPDWYKKKYGHIKEETEIVEDNSALDAMDAKEKRKDKIRKFIKNQSPVKVKHTPGKQTVQKEEIELDEALKGGEKAAYDMGFTHGRKNSPKIDANKSFGSYSKHYHDGYHAGKSSAETEDWHEEQKSKRLRREEVELEESEKNKRINQALADTERYIEKESKRDPKLRPKEVQDRLDFYVKHREKLKSMIENVENIDELSNELLDRYKKAAGESAREADKKGDFKKGDKRFSGIVKATKKQFDNDEKHSVKEDVEINEESEETITHHAHMHKGKSYYSQRKDGHKYVGMAGYKKGGKGGTYKSGMIVQHKDSGKYAVGNISDKTVWHDKVEDAVAHAHKRFKMDHKNVSADKVHVDYD